MDPTTDNKSNGNGATPTGSMIVPASLHLAIDFDFKTGQIKCQVSPANMVSYSQLISILGQLTTTFAQQNMQAEAAMMQREAARLTSTEKR
jgi:hypothetical protein